MNILSDFGYRGIKPNESYAIEMLFIIILTLRNEKSWDNHRAIYPHKQIIIDPILTSECGIKNQNRKYKTQKCCYGTEFNNDILLRWLCQWHERPENVMAQNNSSITHKLPIMWNGNGECRCCEMGRWATTLLLLSFAWYRIVRTWHSILK